MEQERKQDPMSVMLTSRDMARSVAFYRDVLGFALAEAWPDRDRPMWASFVLDGQAIMLGAAMDAADVDERCGDDPETAAAMKEMAAEFDANVPGAGVNVYLRVPDVDAYHALVKKRGAPGVTTPKTQFYGQRDFGLRDPDGYRLCFYTPVVLAECQSCGMPLADAQPGQMYCSYCTDDHGDLRPYEQVFEGTVAGYFMGMQKMSRPDAERAAKDHLSKMPAWCARG